MNRHDGCCNSNSIGSGLVYRDEIRPEEPCCEKAPELPYKGYEVRVTTLDFGYLVNVGCKTFCFESTKKMVKYLEMYWKDPKGTETLWYSGKLMLED
jgi:hypothetical protein